MTDRIFTSWEIMLFVGWIAGGFFGHLAGLKVVLPAIVVFASGLFSVRVFRRYRHVG